MHAIGSRRRSQPAPPHAVFAALTNPDRDPTRPWLILRTDEQRPEVLESTYPSLVIWTTLWPKHPTAQLHFDLPPDNHGGTHLRWTLFVTSPDLDTSTVGHLRHRINTLINANLRRSFGQ